MIALACADGGVWCGMEVCMYVYVCLYVCVCFCVCVCVCVCERESCILVVGLTVVCVCARMCACGCARVCYWICGGARAIIFTSNYASCF